MATATATTTSTPPTEAQEPKVHLGVLIISGQSHVYSFEPETTVGRVKELIWSMWPSEWTEPSQPQAPNRLKVLYAGRVLADDSSLISNNLPVSTSPSTPTVIHLSVRSFSIRADAKKHGIHRVTTRASSHNAPHAEEVSGCKCIIM